MPGSVIHDQGREFENFEFYNVKRFRTTPYHLQCNGQVERMNQSIILMLKNRRWKDHINKLVHASNCIRHSSTGYSPYFLLYRRIPRLTIDIILNPSNGIASEEVQHPKFVEDWKDQMSQAYQIAIKNSK